jgi:uncharacterized integral membrane protein
VKLIRLVIFLAAVIVGVSVGISNRQPVAIALEPIPYSIELPLFVVIFASLFVGILFGGLVVWWQDGRVRRRARRAEVRAVKLEKELADTEQEPKTGSRSGPAPHALKGPKAA